MNEEKKITITLQVAQRPISIAIKREWEHYFREAEKVINDSFQDFAKKWTYKDQQDLLSKVLIDCTVKRIVAQEKLKEYEEELVPMMESLKELTDKLDID